MLASQGRKIEVLSLLGFAELLRREECRQEGPASQPAVKEGEELLPAGENGSGFPRAVLNCNRARLAASGDEKLFNLVIWYSNNPIKWTPHCECC